MRLAATGVMAAVAAQPRSSFEPKQREQERARKGFEEFELFLVWDPLSANHMRTYLNGLQGPLAASTPLWSIPILIMSCSFTFQSLLPEAWFCGA